MSGFCGLCQCEVEGSWEEHVKSQQHRDNLADPDLSRRAKMINVLEYEKAVIRAREHKADGV